MYVVYLHWLPPLLDHIKDKCLRPALNSAFTALDTLLHAYQRLTEVCSRTINKYKMAQFVRRPVSVL